jgi:hypothetical protein
MRVAAWTVTATSDPESGIKVMTFPWIALMVPMRLTTEFGGAWTCGPADEDAQQVGTHPAQTALRNDPKTNMDTLLLVIRPTLYFTSPRPAESGDLQSFTQDDPVLQKRCAG